MPYLLITFNISCTHHIQCLWWSIDHSVTFRP